MKRREGELIGLVSRHPLSHFIFIKIDLRWIYSGYWLALAAQLPSPSNGATREQIELALRARLVLFPSPTSFSFHLALAATGRRDILIFSCKNKEDRERRADESRNVRETQFFPFAPYPFALLPSPRPATPTSLSLDPFSSDCLAPGKRARHPGVQGKYSAADGCAIL